MKKNRGSGDDSGINSEKNVNKVIKLKTPGTRRVQMKLDIREKRAALTASLLSVIALVTLFNQKIVSHFASKDTASRSIASLNERANFEFEWQKELAQKLSKETNRGIASYGDQPSQIDQIRFGILEGKYSLSVVNDKISEITFQETSTADRPKYIPNVENFLIENKAVFAPSLTLIKTLEGKESGELVERTLELYGPEQENLGKVTYTADKSGRFLSMKVQPTP